MQKQKGMATFIVLAWLAICAVLAVGWVMNIVKLIGMLDGAVTAMFIARIVGALAAPIGGVLGYF